MKNINNKIYNLSQFAIRSNILLWIAGFTLVLIFSRLILYEFFRLRYIPFNQIFVLSSNIFIVLCIVSIHLSLWTLYTKLHNNLKNTIYAFIFYCIVSFLLITMIATLKTFGLEILSNAEVWNNFSFTGVKAWTGLSHIDNFFKRYNIIQIFLIEYGLLFIIIFSYSLIGYKFGGCKLSIFFSMFLYVLFIFLHAKLFQLFLWDFDKFHADIYSGTLLYSSISPFEGAWDAPYSIISLLIYSIVILANLILIKKFDPFPGSKIGETV